MIPSRHAPTLQAEPPLKRVGLVKSWFWDTPRNSKNRPGLSHSAWDAHVSWLTHEIPHGNSHGKNPLLVFERLDHRERGSRPGSQGSQRGRSS